MLSAQLGSNAAYFSGSLALPGVVAGGSVGVAGTADARTSAKRWKSMSCQRSC
jgi:hypothetical protein